MREPEHDRHIAEHLAADELARQARHVLLLIADAAEVAAVADAVSGTQELQGFEPLDGVGACLHIQAGVLVFDRSREADIDAADGVR